MSVVEEYICWQLSLTLLKFVQDGCNEKQAYEMKNILERWLISTYNDIESVDEKMISEIIEKKLASADAARELMEKVLEIKQNFVCPESSHDIVVSRKDIKYGQYNRSIDPRIQYLLSKGQSDQVVIMLLRYESILPGGQHWGVPWTVTDYLYELGFRNEGFASPLNSRFIDKPNGKFCSLFLDTDAQFGSLGSFFLIKIKDHPGGWLINPPMIASLLDSILEKIEEFLDETQRSVPIFFSMGAWTDTQIYKRLSRSPYLIDKVNLNPGKYYYETPERQKVTAYFRSVYFILGKSFSQKILKEIAQRWV